MSLFSMKKDEMSLNRQYYKMNKKVFDKVRNNDYYLK